VGQNDDPLPIASPQLGHLLLPIIRFWPIAGLGAELKKIAVLQMIRAQIYLIEYES